MARPRALIAYGAALAFAGAAPVASAQAGAARWELRGDAILGTSDGGLHFGVGALSRLSTYTRAAVVVGGGPAGEGATARAEVALRFHTDPMRERRWGLYASAGGGAMFADTTEPFLLALIGFERSRPAGWAPAVEAGLGRGVRVAFVLRRARGPLR